MSAPEEYIPEEEEEEEDDELEFVPGAEEGGDEEEEANVLILDGNLSLDSQQTIHYTGDGFNLQSTEPLIWNFLDSGTKPPQKTTQFTLQGTCDVVVGPGKATPRTFAVTLGVPQSNGIAPGLKSTGEEEEEDLKKPSVSYEIIANQVGDGDLMEFRGIFTPGGDSVNLVCQVRIAAAKPAAAAPAKAAAAYIVDDDDDEAEYDDENVDNDELINLHEDACLSVEELRKRYHGGGNEEPNKKLKAAPVYDDDDDDIGF